MFYICHIERFDNRPEESRTIMVPADKVPAVSAYLRQLWEAGHIDEFFFNYD